MEKLITIASNPKIGVKVHAQGDTIERVTLFLWKEFVLDCPSEILCSALIPWLRNYAQKKWTPFPLPPSKTPFAQKVTACLRKIPPGQLISYQQLAGAIGHPKAARAIGNFCQSNLFPLLIPCHRVIPSTGGIGAFTPDPRIKQQLLQFEGITVFNSLA